MINEGLQTITNNFSSTHIGLALEYLYGSRMIKQYNKQAFSCIIHGFIGLESYVNYLGYELFFNKESYIYIANTGKDIALKKLLNSWNSSLPILDKIEYILYIKNVSLPDNLKFKLVELNNLRNWLIHGFSYKTTYLMQVDIEDKNRGHVLDIEDEINWKQKFSHTKFKSISFLDFRDAETATTIVLEVLKILVNIYKHPLVILLNQNNELQAKSISAEDDEDIYKLILN